MTSTNAVKPVLTNVNIVQMPCNYSQEEQTRLFNAIKEILSISDLKFESLVY